jgi:hypothetical protein
VIFTTPPFQTTATYSVDVNIIQISPLRIKADFFLNKEYGAGIDFLQYEISFNLNKLRVSLIENGDLATSTWNYQNETSISFIYDSNSQYIYENTEIQKITTVYFELISDNTKMITESDFESSLIYITGTINSDVMQTVFTFSSFPDTVICHLDPNDYKSDIMINNIDEITYIRNVDSAYFKIYDIERVPRLQGNEGRKYINCAGGGLYINEGRHNEIYGGSADSPNIQGYMICMFKKTGSFTNPINVVSHGTPYAGSAKGGAAPSIQSGGMTNIPNYP